MPLRHVSKLRMLDLEPVGGQTERRRDRGRRLAHVALKQQTPAKLWHARLGHRNYRDIQCAGRLGVGMPEELTEEGACEACELGKHKRQSFPAVERRAKKPLEVLHADVLTGLEKPSLGGGRCAVMYTDEATQYRLIYILKHKGEVVDTFKAAVERLESLMADAKVRRVNCMVWELAGGRVRELRADNGGEFISGELKAYCAQRRILQTFGGPYTPEQNGIAERSWRTVVEMARTMRLYAALPLDMWGEALNTAVYILNRLPCKALPVLDGKAQTPYFALLGRHANLSHLRVWGCRAFVHYPDHQQRKMTAKSWRGILVGYDSDNPWRYRVYDPLTGKVRKTVHVSFDEQTLPGRQHTEPVDEAEFDLELLAHQERGAQQQAPPQVPAQAGGAGQ